MKGLSILVVVALFAISLVSASGYYGDFSPQGIFQNEWVQFVMILLIVFGLCYLALVNFFAKGKKIKEVEPEQKRILGIIAFGIAMLSAVGFVQRDWLKSIFGEAMGLWLLIISLIIIVIITVPFYKALKKNIGRAPAIFAFIFIIWLVIKFFTSRQYYFEMPYETYNMLEFLSGYTSLVIALIIGIIISFIRTNQQ